MDKLNTTIAQALDFNRTDAAPATAEARSEVRALDDSELVYVGGGDSIPTW